MSEPSEVNPTPPSETYRCVECGKIWTERSVRGQHYIVDRAGEAHCVRKPDCRGRRLPSLIRLDRDVWGRVGRRHWLDQMDVRPGWQPNRRVQSRNPTHRQDEWRHQGWYPKYTEMERVEACLKYHSWCYPVCMPYASRLNEDESDVLGTSTVTGRFFPLRVVDISDYLNMAQPSVSRAIRGLIARAKLTVDEAGGFCPNQAPPEVTMEQRRALYVLPSVSSEDAGRELSALLRAIPKHKRNVVRAYCEALARIADDPDCDGQDGRFDARAAEDALSQFCEHVEGICTRFREALSQCRSERIKGLDEACSNVAILFPRIQEVLPSRTYVEPMSTTSPAVEDFPSADEADTVPLGEQYAEAAAPAPAEESEDSGLNPEYNRIAPAPYMGADVALFFMTVHAWQQHYPTSQFGRQPISIAKQGDRTFASGTFQLLQGGAPERAADLLGFLDFAFDCIFPDHALGKALPKANSLGMVKYLAKRYQREHPGSYGQHARAEAERRENARALQQRHQELERSRRELEVRAQREWRQLDEGSRVFWLDQAKTDLTKKGRHGSRWENLATEDRPKVQAEEAFRLFWLHLYEQEKLAEGQESQRAAGITKTATEGE